VDQVAEFRASKYTNRKKEAKLNVSGSVEAFTKLAKGDSKLQAEFNSAVSEGLKAETKAKA
jgi:hypothetical protein